MTETVQCPVSCSAYIQWSLEAKIHYTSFPAAST